MNIKQFLIRSLQSSCFFYFGLSGSLGAQDGIIRSSPERKPALMPPSWQEVASLGAPTTGSLVEGSIGAIHKGCRHRFYCHSSAPLAGFMGPQTIAKPISLRDQPGVFPAPLMGAAAITFNFSCQDPHLITPIVVRPDGTVFKGLPMSAHDSPQTLVVSSPAQTGIYTLFVLSHQKNFRESLVKVSASINTQPQNIQTFNLKPFGHDHQEQDAGLISGEFVYIPS